MCQLSDWLWLTTEKVIPVTQSRLLNITYLLESKLLYLVVVDLVRAVNQQ